MTLLAIFNLRQKVYKCIYTHFDVHKKNLQEFKKLVSYYFEFEFKN